MCDALQKWFAAEVKKVEIDEVEKFNFLMNNAPRDCQICDFPIDPFAEGGWFHHVCLAEYLYLENIYSKRELFKMGISEFEVFFAKIKQLMGYLGEFCSSIEFENLKSLRDGVPNEEVDRIIADITSTRTARLDKKNTKEPTKTKAICCYLYKKSVRFLKNDNISLELPFSNNFSSNLSGIASNKPVVHHSHVSGKIVGFVHEFCNLKVRENYYTIPVIAHNQFRFDFFFIMMSIRPTVWETTEIKIGAKNASNVNFAAIGNQVRFRDTIKYFQQSLENLADSMNDTRVLQYRLLECYNTLC